MTTSILSYRCDNCDHVETDPPLARNLHQRLDEDGVYTEHECSECGALTYPETTEPPSDAGPAPHSYTATWSINVTADSYEDAARQAATMARTQTFTTATVWNVTCDSIENDAGHDVDLQTDPIYPQE